MKYILTGTQNGRSFTFYIKALAKTYQQAYGGSIIEIDTVLETPTPVKSQEA